MKALTENGTKITIDDQYEIKRGGEGKILTIPELPNQVAKIYLNSNYQHFGKAQKDALSVLDARFFVKPLELIVEEKKPHQILGFTMEYLSADFIPLAALFTKNFCIAQNIDEKFKFDLAIKLIQALQLAHNQQVIIGDLSGLNVMVNLQGEVKFLDVDSYETPIHSHWGLLFDEIRDYLYQGKVSQQSDFFALAVLIFNLFCYIHPFKGVHKHIKSMAERMINRLPVFAQDVDLIVPKCYQPIQDSFLQQQFQEIFLEGKRYLLQLNQKPIVITQPKTTQPTVIGQSNLKIKEIYQLEAGEYIQKAHFTQRLSYIQTNQKVLIFDVSNHGYTTLKFTLAAAQLSNLREILIGEQNIFILTNQSLSVFQTDHNSLKISNFRFSETMRYRQIGNILVVLDGDFMRYLYLDEVIKDQIRMEQTPVFTPSFSVFNGLIQNTGGMQYLFYHSGKTISTVKSALNLQSVQMVGKVGLASYTEQIGGETTLRYEYFSIQNLQMLLSGEKTIAPKSFAYKAQNAEAGIIFEPADDQILVRKSADFQVIQAIDCQLISHETNLISTHAGIVAWEKDFCYLLNSN
jgi:serine/threonine protein kinase